MIQLKCPDCGMVVNLSEKAFEARYNGAPSGFTFDPENPLTCTSCGEEIPKGAQGILRKLIRKEGFGGWEIGTCFPPEK